MDQSKIRSEYFKWICQFVGNEKTLYSRLLRRLFNKEFTYILPMDENRAKDGVSLRYRFIHEYRYRNTDAIRLDDRPCSVLEMMVALALRCEEDIMYDPEIGDCTSQWFWDMIGNLKLDSMTNSNFDGEYVDYILNCFLSRNYKRNGEGGLFTIRHSNKDLRSVEIWYQMCWYLDSVIKEKNKNPFLSKA